MSKLNVLLAQTDHLNSVVKANITEQISKFGKNQSLFRGEKVLYKELKPEYADPSKNVDKPVSATVKENLDYTFNLADQFLQVKLNQEATNCSGIARAELVIDGISYGVLSTGELLALKGFFEATYLRSMLEAMPTISLSERWKPSENLEYVNRNIVESPTQEWLDKATETETHVKWDPSGKQPGVAIQVKTTLEKANVTRQLFSGEISHYDKASILTRLTKIIVGIKEALEVANSVEATTSNCSITSLLAYLKG